MALWKARGGKVCLKNSILDHGIVEGKGGSLNKDLEFRSWMALWKARGGKFKSRSRF